MIESVQRLGHRVVANPFLADLVVTVHWIPMTNWRYQLLRFKKVLTLATNFIDLDDPAYTFRREFEKVNRLTTAWIAPSTRQMRVFAAHGVQSFYQPFYPDDVFYRAPRLTKREICDRLGLDYARIEGRVVIASIQRDTEGADLRTPKWSKGPHVVLELVKSLPDRERFVLLLSGPRRHYLIQECRRLGIPYVYTGKEPGEDEDDILTNLLDPEMMPLLYQLTDVYLVTSQHEGGPKAVLESAMMKTFILSTDVGLAPDFLDPQCIVRDVDDYARRLRDVVAEFPSERIAAIIEAQSRKAWEVLSPGNMDRLVGAAIDGVLNA